MQKKCQLNIVFFPFYYACLVTIRGGEKLKQFFKVTGFKVMSIDTDSIETVGYFSLLVI
jgi:hypothetical protein